MLASLWRYRALAKQLILRDISGRYRGSLIGMGWSFVQPVVLLLIYTFLFTVVFKARWGVSQDAGHADFALVLFVGIIIHGFFSECLTRAPGLVLANPNYVKKVVFPLEVLPVVAVGAAVFHMMVSVLILALAVLLFQGSIASTIVFLPLVLTPLVIGAFGFVWILASLGVYLRDIAQAMGFVSTVFLFLSPVFYPVKALPEAYRGWLMANPLTFVIEQARAVTLFGTLPDFHGLLIYSAVAFSLAWVGYWWFQRTRKGFADVL